MGHYELCGVFTSEEDALRALKIYASDCEGLEKEYVLVAVYTTE